jgi:hypothetical protein
MQVLTVERSLCKVANWSSTVRHRQTSQVNLGSGVSQSAFLTILLPRSVAYISARVPCVPKVRKVLWEVTHGRYSILEH